MNKIIIIASVIISIILFNFGFSFNGQAIVLNDQKEQIYRENNTMTQELKQKAQFVKKAPVRISKAFCLLINLLRMLENYSGTKMELSFITKGEKNILEDYFSDSTFRNVKILPIVLKINKFSKESDLASVLKDIYVLEKQTDLKVNVITNENDVLEVKGELYGI